MAVGGRQVYNRRVAERKHCRVLGSCLSHPFARGTFTSLGWRRWDGMRRGRHCACRWGGAASRAVRGARELAVLAPVGKETIFWLAQVYVASIRLANPRCVVCLRSVGHFS